MLIYPSFIRLRFLYALAANSGVVLAYLGVVTLHHGILATPEGILVFVNNTFFLHSAMVICTSVCYSLEMYTRRDFLQRRDIFLEQQKAERLLLNILPPEIATRLKNQTNGHVIADQFDAVSILFADVVNFTPMSATMEPAELVRLLNEVFSHFDRLVGCYGLEKIKAIGDCYMIASGVPRPRADHALALTQVALEMRDYVDQRDFAGHPCWNVGTAVPGLASVRKSWTCGLTSPMSQRTSRWGVLGAGGSSHPARSARPLARAGRSAAVCIPASGQRTQSRCPG